MRWVYAVAPFALLLACTDDAKKPVTGTITALSRDARGVPRLVHADAVAPASGATVTEQAREHVTRLAATWRVKQLPDLVALGEVAVRGGTIARLDQVIDGLPVWGGELRVLERPGGVLQTVSGTVVDATTPRDPARFVDDRAGAITRAAAGAHVERAIAKQVWYPIGGGLTAAWVVDAYTSTPTSTNGDATRTIISADGRVLSRKSLVEDAFSYRVFAETTGEDHPLDGPTADATPHPTGVPDKSYPPYISPSLVTVDGLNHPTTGTPDPWLAVDATETLGNNVDAYVDINSPSGLSTGDFRAATTGALAFDYVYDTAQSPLANQTQQMAAITSLFYVMNWLHDFWYDAGFTEASGNAQASNYGRGGVEGDPLLGEAQDNANGGSRNNANMSTPMDGMSPRMQVYLWTGKDDRSLTMSPSNRTPDVGTAAFGPKDFDVTAAMIVGNDGTGTNPTDGCEAMTVTCTGKIVVVDRGNCTFKRKALNIQNAGGVGMILVNNTTSTSPPPMGDDSTLSNTITIAMLSVTDVEGAQIKTDIGNGTVTGTMHRRAGTELEGSLDSTLVAHEFGHYLHHRLSTCGTPMCGAMSEGWGDFDALMTIARPGDNLDAAFPFAIYATQGFSVDAGYYGIRRAPYSVNKAINSLSFRHMADGVALPTTQPMLTFGSNSEVHNAGEVWASALWEGYVALRKAGTSFQAVRSKMAGYVVAGLLLTPPDASPLETRDALLQAAAASSAEDHDLLMAAFARRGFGSCAVAPPPLSTDFTEIVESTIVAGNPHLDTMSLVDDCDGDGVLDTGESGTVKLKLTNQGHAALTDVTLTVTSSAPGVSVISEPTHVAHLDPFATIDLDVQVQLAEGLTDPVPGDFTVTVTSTGACEPTATFNIPVAMNVDEKAAASATDTFDTADSLWMPWTAAWQHVRESSLDGAWRGADLGEVSDTRLTSPSLTASDTDPLVITFQHRFSFETSQSKNWDGGVIEYTIDDGATWEDVATLTQPGYNATITTDAGNVLGDRMAYSARNPSYPLTDTVTLDFGTALAGKTFRIRFRIATDGNTGDEGWIVDDVAFSGIVGTPFTMLVADDASCAAMNPDGEDPVSGGGGCCNTGSLGDSGLLALGVLGLVLRRRRRRFGCTSSSSSI